MNPDRFKKLGRVLDRRQPDLTVLMESVNKPHNFSAILRNCDAVGVLEAHAVPPEKGLTIHHHTSAGAQKWVPVQEHTDIASAVRFLKDRGFNVVAAHPSPEADDYREVDFCGPTTVLVGAELFGISEKGLSLADRTVSIPMAGMAASLNVSVATAVLLFEAFRQRSAAGLYDRCRLDPEERTRLLFEWTYPKLAEIYRRRGEPYPELGRDGTILKPAIEQS